MFYDDDDKDLFTSHTTVDINTIVRRLTTMTQAQELRFIEKQRGRARRLRKEGIYSPALASLERRAEKAGIKNIFSKSTRMSPEEREKQLNLLYQFSKAKTSTVRGAKENLITLTIATNKARGVDVTEVLNKRFSEQWKWYERRKETMTEVAFIGELWEVLKSDYTTYKYSQTTEPEAMLTTEDIKSLINEANYQGEFVSEQILDNLRDYLESGGAEYVELARIINNVKKPAQEQDQE